MAYKIVVTDAFAKSAVKTSQWIASNWSIASAEKFDEKITDTITSIFLNPKSGRQSRRKKSGPDW